jgi:hypothetical protein
VTSTLYKTEMVRYFKSPEILIFSLLFPTTVSIMKWMNIMWMKPIDVETYLVDSLLYLCLPSLADALFLTRSFLSKGFLIRSKTIGKKVSLATLFFTITVSLLRNAILLLSFDLSVSFLINGIVTLTLLSSVYALFFISVSIYIGCGGLAVASATTLTFIMIFKDRIKPLPEDVRIWTISLAITVVSWLFLYLLIKKRLDTVKE